MSGSESESFSPNQIDESDLQAFEATGYAGASKLRGSGKRTRTASAGWLPDLLGAGPGQSESMVSSSGEDVSSILTAFQEWQKKFKKSEKEHEEYVKLSQDHPGRSATILTPMSGPESKSILGAPISNSKTVLG